MTQKQNLRQYVKEKQISLIRLPEFSKKAIEDIYELLEGAGYRHLYGSNPARTYEGDCNVGFRAYCARLDHVNDTFAFTNAPKNTHRTDVPLEELQSLRDEKPDCDMVAISCSTVSGRSLLIKHLFSIGASSPNGNLEEVLRLDRCWDTLLVQGDKTTGGKLEVQFFSTLEAFNSWKSKPVIIEEPFKDIDGVFALLDYLKATAEQNHKEQETFTQVIFTTKNNHERNIIINNALDLGYKGWRTRADYMKAGSNLQTLVVYNERGKPWIKLFEDCESAAAEFPLAKGIDNPSLSDVGTVLDSVWSSAGEVMASLPELPEINHYTGEYDHSKDRVVYGCAVIDMDIIRNINKQFRGNRDILSVVLSSGVTITKQQAKEIFEHEKAFKQLKGIH